MNRREFLKRLGIGLGGAVVAPALPDVAPVAEAIPGVIESVELVEMAAVPVFPPGAYFPTAFKMPIGIGMGDGRMLINSFAETIVDAPYDAAPGELIYPSDGDPLE